ncbi:putative Aluminum activated malate transporter family protein [Tripterygium wilfordii]|uniref:Putative Aluminum activated malate transporter family protein n=1 Tax=Tripterygium wilfordii TaxID=458696 RepID=A0A7J7CBG2_TRIWF|nr:aluminum-activated malate transporter 2-like [Tripterygium wilfordii]KAF5731524.1 putative Aluminum activated malate transporter family protein [Tripterygium wilfordii]
MDSVTVIAIPGGEEVAPKKTNDKSQNPLFLLIISFLRENKRKLLHSIKVGIALVLVSLLYLLDPLYEQVGENAMWAIMTVVVIFEFYAGALLSKGLNRGIGTVLGGGLGCLAASFAQQVGGIGNGIVVGISVFIIGAAATYTRLFPNVKRRYDYGVMIFILTFNLVLVSGLRAEKIMEIARERLSTIVMGFSVCIFTSLFIFPIWSSDELHDSLVSRFEHLASAIEGCVEEFFKFCDEKENRIIPGFDKCKTVLNSKSKDELLANFARWEPWHGKFGFSYPWEKYLKIAEHLRELAAMILSLRGCLESPRQAPRESIEEPCEAIVSSLSWTLKELGESIKRMGRCKAEDTIVPKLKSVRVELSLVMSPARLGSLDNSQGLAMASFVFTLMGMVEKVEELAKEVEELGEIANFQNS